MKSSRFFTRNWREIELAFARTFFARGVAALGSLALALVIGRVYGPAGMGVYALAQSFLIGIATLARQGMQNSLMRYVGQDYNSSRVMLYLTWALRRAFVLSVLGGIVVLPLRFQLEQAFSAKGLAEVLIGVAIAAPAFTASFLFSGFFKGVRKPATAVLLENGSVALIAGFIIACWGIYRESESLAIIGYSYALASWVVVAQALFQLWLWRKKSGCHPQANSQLVSHASFMRTSRAFFFTNLANFMQSVLGVMLAGLVLSSSELGLFKSSQQVSVLISFVLIVINAIFPPRFASLYYQGRITELSALARQGAIVGVGIAAPLLLICLLAPEWVLGWFGEDFRAGATLLRVVAVAQLVNVATGSVGFLLNMTGHERLMRNIALTCSLIGLILFSILPGLFGAIGAVLALAFVLVTQNITAMIFVWLRLGIWTLPGPNLLKWVRVK